MRKILVNRGKSESKTEHREGDGGKQGGSAWE
jgi:hypothetical protein